MKFTGGLDDYGIKTSYRNVCRGARGARKKKINEKKNIDLPLGHGKDRSDEEGTIAIGQCRQRRRK